MAKKASKPPAGTNGAARPSGAYFLSLSLENVRCFREKQTLDLSDGKGGPARWTILLGNNGTGKTTVLQALAAFFCNSRDNRRSPHPPFVVRSPSFSSIRDILIRGSFRRGDKGGVLQVRVATGSTLSVDNDPWVDFEETLSLFDNSDELRNQSVDFPCFCAYGASRRSGNSGLKEPNSEDSVLSLFFDQVSLLDAEEWLLRLDYSVSKASPFQKRQKGRLARIRSLLLAILEEIDDLRFTTKEGVNPTSCVEFRTPYGWVPLRALGYGYQTLIAWMVDFASQMIERYPDSPDPLAEPAIVLVDEIDLHLHPQWQRKLIGHLTERFPNTQFIATAHSPLVVQAAGNANLAVLRREGDQVVIDNDVKAIRGWRIDQIYTSELFGLPSARPPELDGKLARRKELLLKEHLTQREKRELAELDAVITSLPGGETPEQAETLRLIQESLDALKNAAPSTP